MLKNSCRQTLFNGLAYRKHCHFKNTEVPRVPPLLKNRCDPFIPDEFLQREVIYTPPPFWPEGIFKVEGGVHILSLPGTVRIAESWVQC